MLVLLAWMVPVSAFCQKPAAGLYHDPQYRFEAQPPAGSKVYYAATAGSDVGFEAHVGDDTFYVHAEPAPTDDLTDFVTKQEKAIRDVCSNEPQFQQQETTISGKPGMELHAICASNDPDALSTKRVVEVQMVIRQLDDQGTVVYTVGMVTTPKHEAKANEIFNNMASSFRLLD